MRTRKFLSTLIPALPMLLAALLVILVTVIFLTAMRSKAHAQLWGVEQPMFQLSSAQDIETLLLQNAAYRWVSLDHGTNIALTNWVDRIQGAWFSQGDATKRPTNAANGFYIGNNIWCTNTVLTLTGDPTTNCSIGFILNVLTNSFGGNFHPPIWASSPDNLATSTGYKFVGNTTYPLARIGPPSGVYVNEQFPLTNQMISLVFSETNRIAVGCESMCYTNGVLYGSPYSIAGSYFPGPLNLKYLGFSPSQAGRPQYRIRELWVWTNKINSLTLSNFHYYTTNTYPTIQ